MTYSYALVAGQGTADFGRRRVPIKVVWPVSDSNAATEVSINESSLESVDDSIGAAKVDSLCSRAIAELEEYRNLAPGWDGYHALPFDPELVSRAEDVCYEIVGSLRSGRIEPQEITPGPASDGSLDIQVVVGRNEVILSLYPDQENVTIYTRRDHNENEAVSTLGAGKLEQLLSWLAS